MSRDSKSTRTEGIRLNRFLAEAGLGSRRSSEELVLEGRVTVNGIRVSSLATRVRPEDEVRVDGRKTFRTHTKVYLAVNKPPKYICANSDPEGRKLVIDLVRKDFSQRLFTVGRLDFLSTGLIFLTNDGDFAQIVSHPSFSLEKEYVVDTKKPLPDEVLDEFSRGIRVESEQYRLKKYERFGPRRASIVLEEGKNREIRNVLNHFRLGISRLKRVRIGPVVVKGIPVGGYRRLKPSEIAWFFDKGRKS
jgi:23S rRNA pseudouridine2605 synthase